MTLRARERRGKRWERDVGASGSERESERYIRMRESKSDAVGVR